MTRAATSDRYLDDYLPVIAIDVAAEEKMQIATLATATLHKLHNLMRQMKDWRDDSARLKSKIWRMKMALRADDKDEGESRADPLIAHQRAEISRLEQTKDALENEVTALKRALVEGRREMGEEMTRVEFSDEEARLHDEILRLRRRLKELEESHTGVAPRQLGSKLSDLASGDQAIEMILANTIGRVVETIVGLSEELVNVSEDLCRSKTKNRNLRVKLDRLRAMLRSRSGNSAEYRKRIDELNDLAERLMTEMGRLRVIRENASYGGSSDAADIADVIRHVGRLMNELRNNLKSDRQAMIAAGEPDCLRYMKRVIDLRVNLKVLFAELKRSSASVHERSGENVDHESCSKTVWLLSDFLKEVDVEVDKLKLKPLDRYCRIGGISSTRYMKKVVELENIVRKSVAVLKQSPWESVNAADELDDLIKRLCCKMRELEILDDRRSLRERIGRLETSMVRLRLELLEKSDRANALSDERGRNESIIVDLRRENEGLRADAESGKRGVSRERECSQRRIAEMKAEVAAARKKWQDDKEALLGETERVRDVLRERDREIESIVGRWQALEGVLRAEAEELRARLGIASDENAKLRSIIEGLEKRERERERLDKLKSSAEEGGAGVLRDNGERAGGLREEVERGEAESSESKARLGEANERVDCLRRELDTDAAVDAARLEREISALRSTEESLTYRLHVQTRAAEQASRDSERTTARNKALEGRVERLEAQLSQQRSEKESLDKSMADANSERAALLEQQANKFKCERNGLRRRISDSEAAAENFKSELARARAELEDAAVVAARLRSENTRLAHDVDAASARGDGGTARINELNDEGARLRDRLSEAEAKNEYLSMELNKSRVANDRAEAKNALLQVTCDERECDNAELRRARDGARRRLNEIAGECRALGDQLRIQRMRYETLWVASHDDNDRAKNQRIDARYPLARNETPRKDPARTSAKLEIDAAAARRHHEAESDIRAARGRGDKARIKDEPKEEAAASPRTRNKTLKAEPDGSGNSLARMEGSKDQREEEVAGPVAKKFEVANARLGRETGNYSAYPDDSKMLEDKREGLAGIDRLEVENRALKMEVDILRGGLNFSLADGEKTKADLGRASEEIQALKLELMSLRDERAALRSRLEMLKEELNGLKSERQALKDELVASRKSNFDLRLRANDLLGANEKLKETNAGLEDRLRDASRQMNQCGVATSGISDGSSRNNFESAARNPRTIKKRPNRFERVRHLRLRSAEENLLRIEGEK